MCANPGAYWHIREDHGKADLITIKTNIVYLGCEKNTTLQLSIGGILRLAYSVLRRGFRGCHHLQWWQHWSQPWHHTTAMRQQDQQ